MSAEVLVVELGIGATNDEIVEQMRIMKKAREGAIYKNVVCVVRGFNDDTRELYLIPEVRAFCRRLVNSGFISYLDFVSLLNPKSRGLMRHAWGAAEVWMCGEGRLSSKVFLTPELIEEANEAYLSSNAKADETVGPMEE